MYSKCAIRCIIFEVEFDKKYQKSLRYTYCFTQHLYTKENDSTSVQESLFVCVYNCEVDNNKVLLVILYFL